MRAPPKPILSIIFAALLVAGLTANSPPSLGEGYDNGITQLKTVLGLLVKRKVMGSDCGSSWSFGSECEVLYLNNKPILAEAHVNIGRDAFPLNADALLVGIGTWTGGNHCCFKDYILDFTKNPPLKFEGDTASDVSRTESGVSFQMYSGKNALGDQLIGTYTYKFGSGRPLKVREEPDYSIPETAEGYPRKILGDPKAREPILKVIGTSHFAKFRDSMGAQGPLKTIEGNFTVGEGCISPGCPEQYAMFVIDTANQLAWAVEGSGSAGLGEEPTAKIWGVLTPNDVVPKREITRWLSEHKVRGGYVHFVPLPNETSILYQKPRKQIAKTEGPPPPLPAAQKATTPTSSPEVQKQDAPHTTVALKQEGGTYVVPVAINGALTLDFTIDSGAADVSIPIDVVSTLLRTGTLTRDDFFGSQTYSLADGSTLSSKTFRIRSLKVGDHVLNNITGSVAPVKGSLLLGQSFLSQFKSWSIDNTQHQLLLFD